MLDGEEAKRKRLPVVSVREEKEKKKKTKDKETRREEREREGGRRSATRSTTKVLVRQVKEAAMGLISFPKVVMPALLGSMIISYAFWDLARNRKIFGGTVPHTIKGTEWEKETAKKLDAWPREAAGPVVMNPISRQNYHKA